MKTMFLILLLLILAAALGCTQGAGGGQATIVTTDTELAKAISAGGVVKPGADITVGLGPEIGMDEYAGTGLPVMVEKDTTIDLNGCTLNVGTGTCNFGHFLFVREDAGLTILDSSPEQTGMLLSEGHYPTLITNNGTMTILSGTIQCKDRGTVISNHGTHTMQGGTVECGHAIYGDWCIVNPGTMKMTGGPVNVTDSAGGGAIKLHQSSVSLKVTGGAIRAGGSDTCAIERGGGKVTIKDDVTIQGECRGVKYP